MVRLSFHRILPAVAAIGALLVFAPNRTGADNENASRGSSDSSVRSSGRGTGSDDGSKVNAGNAAQADVVARGGEAAAEASDAIQGGSATDTGVARGSKSGGGARLSGLG